MNSKGLEVSSTHAYNQIMCIYLDRVAYPGTDNPLEEMVTWLEALSRRRVSECDRMVFRNAYRIYTGGKENEYENIGPNALEMIQEFRMLMVDREGTGVTEALARKLAEFCLTIRCLAGTQRTQIRRRAYC